MALLYLRRLDTRIKLETEKVTICKNCGQIFISKKRGHSKYCSKECCRTFHTSKYIKKLDNLPAYCILCGKKFFRKTHNQKYCKKECCDNFHKKEQEEIKKQNTFLIFERDSFRCQYCGRTPQDKVKLVIDHIYPISKGGDERPNNLITACSECNGMKNNKTLQLNLLFYFWDVASKQEFSFGNAFEVWQKRQKRRLNYLSKKHKERLKP